MFISCVKKELCSFAYDTWFCFDMFCYVFFSVVGACDKARNVWFLDDHAKRKGQEFPRAVWRVIWDGTSSTPLRGDLYWRQNQAGISAEILVVSPTVSRSCRAGKEMFTSIERGASTKRELWHQWDDWRIWGTYTLSPRAPYFLLVNCVRLWFVVVLVLLWAQ